MDTGAIITGAPDVGSCFDGFDDIFTSACEPKFGDGPNCDDSDFACCTSEWDYSSTIESCIAAHATVKCDDYGFPTTDGRSAWVADCSTMAGDFATADDTSPTTTPSDSTPTGTSPAGTKATTTPVATGTLKLLSTYPTASGSKAQTSIVVALSSGVKPSAVGVNGTLASSSVVGVKSSSVSVASKSSSAVVGTSSVKSSGTANASSSPSAVSTAKSSVAGRGDVRGSAVVGFFGVVALVLFRVAL